MHSPSKRWTLYNLVDSGPGPGVWKSLGTYQAHLTRSRRAIRLRCCAILCCHAPICRGAKSLCLRAIGGAAQS